MAVTKPPQTSTHAELMRAMRSTEGFDPMPPSQHGYLLDRDEPMTNRAIAWVWSKTIRPGRGHSRSPFAQDERGPLRHTHAAADLGWTASNTKATFEKLAAQGRIRTDTAGKIWLCGDVPDPRRTNSEAQQKEICTYFLEPRFALYLQGLQENERAQRRSEYEQLQQYKRKLAAEALATARAIGENIELNWQREIGYQPKTEPRGRPKLKRTSPILQLSLLDTPDFVQKSAATFAQNSNATSEQKENGAAQNDHPYVSEVESFRELAIAKNLRAKNNDDAELEEEIVARCEAGGRLKLGGQGLNIQTVRTIRTNLQQLNDNAAIKEVLEVLEEKCRQLAKRPGQASNKTWGWIVGLVRSEVNNRVSQPQQQDQLLATVRAAAAAKGF